jgi:CheY-like chemotaxis protein
MEDGGALFEVSDNGIGFEDHSAAGMFELFAQNGQRGGGLGIGLALAKGLAELHGGRIEAESEGPGKGSRFRVFLPWAMEQAAAVDEMKPSLFSQTSAFKKVLVADDNRDAAEMLADMLTLQGNLVHVTFDGKQAMAAFEHFSPDVTLLDLSMAKVDDFALTRKMRARKAPHAKLIAVSGWGQAKDKQAAIDAGFDQHLTKPVDPQLLRELLQ